MSPGISIVLSTLITTASLFVAAKLTAPAGDMLQLLAQGTAVFGLVALCWAYVLAIRHRVLESLFGGMDRVYAIHRISATIAFILVIYHVIILIVRRLPANALVLYLVPTGPLSYAFGILTFYILLVLMGVTLYVDMPYPTWKRTHEWMGLVIVGGFAHGMLVPSDMSRYGPLTVWLGVVCVTAISAYLYKRFAYYWVGTRRFSVVRIDRDGDIAIVTIKQNGTDAPMTILPGQFVFLSIPTVTHDRDEHPFSVISHDEGTLRFGVRVVGPFTRILVELAPGTEVAVRGPFGTFGEQLRRAKHMVWIAGGIGVTPFLSFAKTVGEDQSVTFIHSVRGDNPSVLAGLIGSLVSGTPHIRYIEHDTRNAGRLSVSVLRTYCRLDAATRVWMCGPPAMMAAVSDLLVQTGVKRKHIYFEDFSFR